MLYTTAIFNIHMSYTYPNSNAIFNMTKFDLDES